MIQIEITASGGVQMLHDDAVNLGEFGEIEVRRASHVEYSDGHPAPIHGNRWPSARGWFVQSAMTGDILKAGIPTRAEALAWEKEYYSPSGAGWAELTGGKS